MPSRTPDTCIPGAQPAPLRRRGDPRGEAESQRARREFLNTALNDLNAAVLSLFDVPDHMRSVLGDACAAIGAGAGFVEMREDTHWRVRYAVGLSDEVVERPCSALTAFVRGARRRRDVVALSLSPEAVEDVRRLRGEDASAALVASLVVAGRLRGLMAFLGSEPFDDLSRDFARKLSASVSLALQAAELFEAEERRVELAEALDRINRLVHAKLDPAEVPVVALEEGCSVLGSASGLVALAEGDWWVVRHQCGMDERIAGMSFRLKEGSISTDLGATKEPRLLDPLSDDRFDPEVVAEFGFRAMLAVPIVSNDAILGAVLFNRQRPGVAFTSEEVDFARRLGATTSLAFENARLYQQQLEVARLNERLSAIDDALHSTLEFDEIVQRALAVGTEALGADTAALSFREDDTFRVAYAHGFSPDIAGTVIPAVKERHSVIALERRETVAIDDIQSDSRCEREHLASYGIRSEIVAPLIVRDEPLANLCYSFSRPHHFGPAEVDFVSRIASSLSLALQNAEQFAAERTIARTLQEALLALPDEVAGVRVSHLYRSAALQARVGGDFYDIFELDHGLLGVVVGDVSGKGLDAAVLTALVKNTIRAHAVEKSNGPSDVLALVNAVLLKESRPETFVTVFFGMLDRRDGRLVYCNAGHPAAVLLREDGVARRLAPNSPIAGAFANAPFVDGESCVGVDDLLFLYTDGLTEARRDRELYGEERLFVQLARICDTGPEEAIRRVVDDVVTFAGGQLDDDVAVLAVKRVPLPSEMPVQLKLPLWSVM